MKIEADGFCFDFTDAIDAFIFDEKDKQKPHYHGLSQAMKGVDIIVELDNDYLARSCVVVNIERWNRNFPNWRLVRLNDKH